MTINAVSDSPGHTARLAEAVGLQLDKRILAFHEAPPPSAASKLMTEHREYARPLYARPGELASSSGAVTNKTRKIPMQPERVLDAPGMVDDFYLNLLAWSSLNVVAVALTENTYIWRADTGDVVHVGEAPEGSYVSSVDFAADGGFLGIGMGTGDVELWDIESNTKLRSMSGHLGQVAVLSWSGHILSSACGDGTIWHHDVRVARHKVAELVGHTGEVCGLKWRPDGELLASGGNDNVVNIWDARMGSSGNVGGSSEATRGGATWTKRSHTAAVKVGAFFADLADMLIP
jgi:cell division cycle protein 20 (cofactor of APC complex)